jgi:hypothetical protein
LLDQQDLLVPQVLMGRMVQPVKMVLKDFRARRVTKVTQAHRGFLVNKAPKGLKGFRE